MLVLFLRPLPCSAQTLDAPRIELSGFTPSEAFNVADNEPFEIGEPSLLKLIYRIRQISLNNLRKYASYSADVTWEKLENDPAGVRFQVFHREGRVQSVSRMALPQAEAGDPQLIYLAHCLTDDDKPFLVASLQAPVVWLKASRLDEPVSFFGFFHSRVRWRNAGSKAEPDTDEQSVPLFVARQIAWYPKSENTELGVSPSHAMLAGNGVDMAGFDLIKLEDRRPFGSKDAKPFFEILDAVGKMKLGQDAPPPISHMVLLRGPTQHYGDRVRFQAKVKQCSIVRPGEHWDVERDPAPYYQLIVFPDLRVDDRNITVEIGKDDQKIVYNRFPFTVCVRRLPDGQTAESMQDQTVIVDGFYFRFWQYDSQITRDAGVNAQISPVIIADEPDLKDPSTDDWSRFIGILLLTMLGLIAIVALAFLRFNRKAGNRKQELPERIDFEDQADSE